MRHRSDPQPGAAGLAVDLEIRRREHTVKKDDFLRQREKMQFSTLCSSVEQVSASSTPDGQQKGRVPPTRQHKARKQRIPRGEE